MDQRSALPGVDLIQDLHPSTVTHMQRGQVLWEMMVNCSGREVRRQSSADLSVMAGVI